jgi:hypothetical protein
VGTRQIGNEDLTTQICLISASAPIFGTTMTANINYMKLVKKISTILKTRGLCTSINVA